MQGHEEREKDLQAQVEPPRPWNPRGQREVVPRGRLHSKLVLLHVEQQLHKQRKDDAHVASFNWRIKALVTEKHAHDVFGISSCKKDVEPGHDSAKHFGISKWGIACDFLFP